MYIYIYKVHKCKYIYIHNHKNRIHKLVIPSTQLATHLIVGFRFQSVLDFTPCVSTWLCLLRLYVSSVSFLLGGRWGFGGVGAWMDVWMIFDDQIHRATAKSKMGVAKHLLRWWNIIWNISWIFPLLHPSTKENDYMLHQNIIRFQQTYLPFFFGGGGVRPQDFFRENTIHPTRPTIQDPKFTLSCRISSE